MHEFCSTGWNHYGDEFFCVYKNYSSLHETYFCFLLLFALSNNIVSGMDQATSFLLATVATSKVATVLLLATSSILNRLSDI